jgi:hypothetical protein
MRKILFGLVFLLAIPFVCSVGVSPPTYESVFKPGMEGEIQFYFRNNLDKAETLLASLEGDLAEYARITSASEALLNPEERMFVTISFKLPDSIGEPGWHAFNVVATESEGSGGTVGARGQVVVPVKFFVQYPGKRLNLRLDASDAGVGEDVKFKLHISNVGTEPVENAQATIDILDDGEKKGTVATDKISVGVMESKIVEASWNSGSIAQGVYLANAVLNYEGGPAYANDTFRIGTFDIDVINFTKKVGKGLVNKFVIEIESKWSQNIENIFATVDVAGRGISFSAATQQLRPWERKNMSGVLDATSLEIGTYPIQINISFSSGGMTKTKIVNGSIEVVEGKYVEEKVTEEKPNAGKNNSSLGYLTTTNILIIIVVLLIIINIIILIRKKKKNEEYV